MDTVIRIISLGVIYAAFGWWTTETEPGKRLKHYLQNWKSDSLLHLVLCAGSVWILGVCAIFILALTLDAIFQ